MEDRDLLLIDAGASSATTRQTSRPHVPANGRFPRAPAGIYQVVLDAQLAAIAACQPGRRYANVHDAARQILTEGLVRLGILPRPVDESLAMHHYREFYMHGTGHGWAWTCTFVGDYRIRGESRRLEPGHGADRGARTLLRPRARVVSYALREYSEEEMWERRFRLGVTAAKQIEDEEKGRAPKVAHPMPAEYRGIGVRIEDDILITETGPRGPHRGHAEDHRRGRQRPAPSPRPCPVSPSGVGPSPFHCPCQSRRSACLGLAQGEARCHALLPARNTATSGSGTRATSGRGSTQRECLTSVLRHALARRSLHAMEPPSTV